MYTLKPTHSGKTRITDTEYYQLPFSEQFKYEAEYEVQNDFPDILGLWISEDEDE